MNVFAGNAEQGQLGRVAECFSNRGGRQGLRKWTRVSVTFTGVGYSIDSLDFLIKCNRLEIRNMDSYRKCNFIYIYFRIRFLSLLFGREWREVL